MNISATGVNLQQYSYLFSNCDLIASRSIELPYFHVMKLSQMITSLASFQYCTFSRRNWITMFNVYANSCPETQFIQCFSDGDSVSRWGAYSARAICTIDFKDAKFGLNFESYGISWMEYVVEGQTDPEIPIGLRFSTHIRLTVSDAGELVVFRKRYKNKIKILSKRDILRKLTTISLSLSFARSQRFTIYSSSLVTTQLYYGLHVCWSIVNLKSYKPMIELKIKMLNHLNLKQT